MGKYAHRKAELSVAELKARENMKAFYNKKHARFFSTLYDELQARRVDDVVGARSFVAPQLATKALMTRRTQQNAFAKQAKARNAAALKHTAARNMAAVRASTQRRRLRRK